MLAKDTNSLADLPSQVSRRGRKYNLKIWRSVLTDRKWERDLMIYRPLLAFDIFSLVRNKRKH